jgi:hypothetical protein
MISSDRLTIEYYEQWYRATGVTRALLVPPGMRQVLGIPPYVLRQAAASLLAWVTAVPGSDQSAYLKARFRWLYFRSFLGERLTMAVRAFPGKPDAR